MIIIRKLVNLYYLMTRSENKRRKIRGIELPAHAGTCLAGPLLRALFLIVALLKILERSQIGLLRQKQLAPVLLTRESLLVGST